MSDIVLEFESLCYNAPSDHMASIENLSLKVEKGSILMMRSDTDSEHAPVIDLGLGLIEPDAGSVRFMGKSWLDMDAFEEAASRGRIGCSFEKPGWISSLSVIDNIKLRERHHTLREDDAITKEVFDLVSEVGLNDPSDIYLRPDAVRRRRLRVYEWVLACMGSPALTMMAFPERGSHANELESLINLVERMAGSGTAVVWITDRDDILNHSKLSKMQIEIEKYKR